MSGYLDSLGPRERARMHLQQLKYRVAKAAGTPEEIPRTTKAPFVLTSEPSVGDVIADMDYLLRSLDAL